VRTEVVAESTMKVMMLQEKYLLLVVVLSSSKVTQGILQSITCAILLGKSTYCTPFTSQHVCS